MTQVAEGVKTTPVVTGIAERLGVELPIAREVDAVLRGAATVEDAYRGLTRTAPGHEIHGVTF
jgi:glycerol-3-phosphate dehydrogenase (NAD(P)+)